MKKFTLVGLIAFVILFSFRANADNSIISISTEKTNTLFQLDKVSSTAGTEGETGTGLGLIISKRLSEIMKRHRILSGSISNSTQGCTALGLVRMTLMR